MDTFIQRFQPQKYTAWLNGEDIGSHPLGGEMLPAPAPSIQDVLVNKCNQTLPQSVVNSLLGRSTVNKKFKKRPNIPYFKQYPDLDIDQIQNRTDVPEYVKNCFLQKKIWYKSANIFTIVTLIWIIT